MGSFGKTTMDLLKKAGKDVVDELINLKDRNYVVYLSNNCVA